MKDQSFKLMLEPRIRDGLDRSEVIGKLAALFKREEDIIDKLLASSPKIIRKNLDRVTAEKYVGLIEAAGGLARIIPDLPETDASSTKISTSAQAEHPGAATGHRESKSEDKSEDEIPRPSPVPKAEEPVSEDRPQYTQTEENICPKCGYKAQNEDDVLLVRGDCPKCGFMVREVPASAEDMRKSEDEPEEGYYEGKLPASWERRLLASLYSFAMFLGGYAALTFVFILIFAPLDSVGDHIFRNFWVSAFDAFPMLNTALIVIVLFMVVPFVNQGKSRAQSEFDIHLLYTPEAQVGGLQLSLIFRVATIMMISFLPGMIVLWVGYAFDRFDTKSSINTVMLVCAALGWGAAAIYARRRPDRRSLLDLAAGTIQIEEITLPDNARKKALIPFSASIGVWILLGWISPLLLRAMKW